MLREEYYDSVDSLILWILYREVFRQWRRTNSNIVPRNIFTMVLCTKYFICNVALLILRRGISRQWHRIVNICIVILHGGYCTAEYFINGFARKIFHCGIFERLYRTYNCCCRIFCRCILHRGIILCWNCSKNISPRNNSLLE